LARVLTLTGVRPDSIIVRCSGKKHRVRLAPGRFWHSAKCQACGARVDPTRLRRIGRWLRHLRFPASARTQDRAVWLATLSYVVVVLLSAALLWWLSDRWWPATTLLFGPRWVLLLPLAGLVPLAVKRDRTLLAPLAVAALIVLGPVMGQQTSWRSWFVSTDAERHIRIATLNAKGAGSLATSVTEMLLDWDVHMLAVQECGPGITAAFQFLEEWHADATGTLCLISRYPITEVAQMEREAFKAAGGEAMVVSYRLEAEPVPIFITNLHLETPREGLERIRAGNLQEGAPRLEGKSTLRRIELMRARRWVDERPHPHIVVGDFNTPPESPIYRDAWSDWTNAFSRAGRGFGYTRMHGWIRARIDHILVDDMWTVVRAWVGPDVGSDHKPMFADVRLRRRSGR
jgi:endonuclease/exonuclease/phosphatase (EEP) superfamily protein YafD